MSRNNICAISFSLSFCAQCGGIIYVIEQLFSACTELSWITETVRNHFDSAVVLKSIIQKIVQTLGTKGTLQ
jgi:hypothetical protein